MSILDTLPAAFTYWVDQVDPSVQIWIVGGAVRDYFLGRSTGDLDFTVSPHALPVAREVATLLQGDLYTLDHERGTVRVLLNPKGADRRLLDFSELRVASIEDDLKSRDFSLNSLAVDLKDPDKLIDPCLGFQDLKDHVLRVSHPQSIPADPLRALRGVRLACELGLRIEDATRKQIKFGAGMLSTVSRERIRDEVFHILRLPDPAQAVHLLARFGLVQALLGCEISQLEGRDTIPAYLAELRASARILDVLGYEFSPEGAADASLGLLTWQLGRFREPLRTYLEEELTIFRQRRALMLLGVCTIGEITMAGVELDPVNVATFLGGSLRLSQREVRWLEMFLAGMDAIQALRVEPVEIYRYFRSYEDSGVASGLAHLARVFASYLSPPPAEVWAREIERIRVLMDSYFEHRSIVEPASLLTGDDLIAECGLAQGPQLGDLLELVREAQVRGEIENREQALDWVVRRLEL